jgi:SAM-dependent methyltransferase
MRRVVDRIRALVYDIAIVGLTAGWYRTVLERLPPASRLLDVGIGTGSALLANAELVVGKRLRINGVDIDSAYVARCNREILRKGLADRIEARNESIYDHRGGPYDAVYFSASFMLLPDPSRALRHVCSLLAPGGRIYFTQTFEHERSRAVEVLKPLLRLATTIDFGRVTYEPDFRRALAQGGVDLDELETLSAGRRRSSVLAVARRAGSTPCP